MSTAPGSSPWEALLAVTAELAFVGGLMLIAEDYPTAVITFLVILWLLFLMVNPHPWRSQAGAPAQSSIAIGA